MKSPFISSFSYLLTEQENEDSVDIDLKSSAEIVSIFQKEDQKVLSAVEEQASAIATAIDMVVVAFRNGGRLLYMGAGTSGRLGVLDSSECPPTFNTEPGQIQGLIAGGDQALRRSVETAEDSHKMGSQVIRDHSVSNVDIVVGIASSGRTPYVLGGLEQAHLLQAQTILICCVPSSPSDADISYINHYIRPQVGPEIIAGSTRLKAGTATKSVLNMLTTGAMIQTGRVYGNLMVNMQASNSKIRDRAVRTVMSITGCERPTAESALNQTDGRVKEAIVCLIRGVDVSIANELLEAENGFLRPVLTNPDAS